MLCLHVITEHLENELLQHQTKQSWKRMVVENCRHICLELRDQIELTQILLRWRHVHWLSSWTIKLNFYPEQVLSFGDVDNKGGKQIYLVKINETIYKRNYYDKLWQWIGLVEDRVQWAKKLIFKEEGIFLTFIRNIVSCFKQNIFDVFQLSFNMFSLLKKLDIGFH